MPLLSGIYDSGPIAPVAKIKENLSLWTVGKWAHYQIVNIEPMPRSSPMVIEMVTASGALTIAANGTINKQIVALLQPKELEFLHIRWEPIDDVEGVLWEQPGSGRFVARQVHARVTRFTALRDPYLATTTFFILGMQRDMSLEVRNPNPVALPQARFVFFGYRYMLKLAESVPAVTTWLPTEGF